MLESDPEAYYNNEELLEPLQADVPLAAERTNDDGIANGRLLDVIRQVPLPACAAQAHVTPGMIILRSTMMVPTGSLAHPVAGANPVN